MSNGSKRQIASTVGKSFIVDYRNAKYQGEVSQYDRVPHGMGMLLTIDYQLIIAHWEDGMVSGQCVIFYSNGSVFYGCVRNGALVGVNIFKVSGYKTIYTYHRGGEQTLVLIDNKLKHTVTSMRIDTADLNKLLAGKKKKILEDEGYEIMLEQDRLQKAIMTLQSSSYGSDEQKWELIGKMSGQTLKNEEKSYKNFLKLHFNSKITPKDKRLQIIQTVKYLELRCKKAGIVLRIEQKGVQSNYIKLMGYFDCYEEQMDIFIKGRSGMENEIEQCCQGHTIVYGSERPAQCRLNLLNYYRKSTNFINRFIKILDFSSFLNMYQAIDTMVETELGMKDAQQQLQSGYDNEGRIQEYDERTPPAHHTSSFRELEQIKNEVYNRVNRRRQSSAQFRSPHKKSLRNLHRDHQGSRYNYDYKQNDEYFEALAQKYKLEPFDGKHKISTGTKRQKIDTYHNKSMKYAEETPSKYPKEYLKYIDSSANRNKHKKSRKYEIESPPAKYSYSQKNSTYQVPRSRQNSKGKNQHKFNLDLNRLKRQDNYTRQEYEPQNHFPKENMVSAFHNQSLGTLTQNYEQIESAMKNERSARSKRRLYDHQINTPTSKSPSRYNYTNTAGPSVTGTPGRSKRQWR